MFHYVTLARYSTHLHTDRIDPGVIILPIGHCMPALASKSNYNLSLNESIIHIYLISFLSLHNLSKRLIDANFMSSTMPLSALPENIHQGTFTSEHLPVNVHQ
jgi:hypothetical protein